MKPDFSLSQIALLLRQAASNAQPGTPDLAREVLKQLASVPGLADLAKGSLGVLQAAGEPVTAATLAAPAPGNMPYYRQNGPKWNPKPSL